MSEMWLFVISAFIANANAVETFNTNYGDVARYNIYGHIPESESDDGGYPLFMLVKGTGADFFSDQAQAYTSYMAGNGYISASIEYDNGLPQDCDDLFPKTIGIFDIDNDESAISMLCYGTPELDIDCSKSIVLLGFSQGAQIVSLAANYMNSSMISGILEMGGGNLYDRNFGGPLFFPCVNYENLAIDQTKIRARLGENDPWHCGESNNHSCEGQLTATTGYSCPNQRECMQNDGSGWYIVGANELEQDNPAGHCYATYKSLCGDRFDTNYYEECKLKCDWSFQSDLQWLITRYKEVPTTTDVVCIADCMECDNGKCVGRDPSNNCEFYPCKGYMNTLSIVVYLIVGAFCVLVQG